MLARVEAENPELYAELVELRGTNPQEYRKRIRLAAEQYPIDGSARLIPSRLHYTHAQHQTDVLEVLAQPKIIYMLRHSLRRGNFDGRLDEIVAAERVGRNRPVVFHMVEEYRQSELRRAEPRPQIPPASDWVPKVKSDV